MFIPVNQREKNLVLRAQILFYGLSQKMGLPEFF